MASSIIETNPVTGNPTTASVRANFSAAKSEIEALQTSNALKAPLASPTFTGTATAATLNTTTFQIGGVTLTATPATLNAIDGRVTALEDAGYVTGNQTITLSGDASGSGTTSIAVTVDMSGLSGTTYAAGSGANITALNASNISSGTISDARLPASISSDITGNAATATTATTALNANTVDSKSVSVVASLPGSPDANTIYFVTS